MAVSLEVVTEPFQRRARQTARMSPIPVPSMPKNSTKSTFMPVEVSSPTILELQQHAVNINLSALVPVGSRVQKPVHVGCTSAEHGVATARRPCATV